MENTGGCSEGIEKFSALLNVSFLISCSTQLTNDFFVPALIWFQQWYSENNWKILSPLQHVVCNCPALFKTYDRWGRLILRSLLCCSPVPIWLLCAKTIFAFWTRARRKTWGHYFVSLCFENWVSILLCCVNIIERLVSCRVLFTFFTYQRKFSARNKPPFEEKRRQQQFLKYSVIIWASLPQWNRRSFVGSDKLIVCGSAAPHDFHGCFIVIDKLVIRYYILHVGFFFCCPVLPMISWLLFQWLGHFEKRCRRIFFIRRWTIAMMRKKDMGVPRQLVIDNRAYSKDSVHISICLREFLRFSLCVVSRFCFSLLSREWKLCSSGGCFSKSFVITV